MTLLRAISSYHPLPFRKIDTTPDIRIFRADSSWVDAVGSFYRRQGYSGGVKPQDALVVALRGHDVVGALRLCVEFDTLVMRGVFVDSTLRGKGIGNRLIKECDGMIGDQECYCVPYRWLEQFYGRIRFRSIPEELAPEFLRERLRNYRNDGNDMIIMKRTNLQSNDSL